MTPFNSRKRCAQRMACGNTSAASMNPPGLSVNTAAVLIAVEQTKREHRQTDSLIGLVSKGFCVYLAEQPALGRSAYHPEESGERIYHSVESLIDRFTSDQGTWTPAQKHTQWPDNGTDRNNETRGSPSTQGSSPDISAYFSGTTAQKSSLIKGK